MAQFARALSLALACTEAPLIWRPDGTVARAASPPRATRRARELFFTPPSEPLAGGVSRAVDVHALAATGAGGRVDGELAALFDCGAGRLVVASDGSVARHTLSLIHISEPTRPY